MDRVTPTPLGVLVAKMSGVQKGWGPSRGKVYQINFSLPWQVSAVSSDLPEPQQCLQTQPKEQTRHRCDNGVMGNNDTNG